MRVGDGGRRGRRGLSGRLGCVGFWMGWWTHPVDHPEEGEITISWLCEIGFKTE